MKLIENYLSEVGCHLEKDKAEDILQELRDSIYEKVSDLEEEHGRALTQEELVSALSEIGHPVKVANNYATQQYLIGPELFPTFKRVLKIALVATFIIQFATLFTINFFAEEDGLSAFGFLFTALDTALLVGIIVIASFAGLEYSGDKFNLYDNWNPLSVGKSRYCPADKQDAVTNVITDTVLFIWWNDWFGLEHSSPFSVGQFEIYVSDIFTVLYWPVNLLLVLSLITYGWQLINCYWSSKTISFAIAQDLAAIAVVLILARANPFLTITNLNDEVLTVAQSRVEMGISLVLLFIFLCLLWDLWNHIKVWNKLRQD